MPTLNDPDALTSPLSLATYADQRRPGRSDDVNPSLIALLRDPTASDAPLSACDRLVRSAAYAAECPAAVFYILSDTVLSVAGCFGTETRLSPQVGQLLMAGITDFPLNGLLVINDVEAPDLEPVVTGLALALGQAISETVRFIAAIQVCGPLDGRPRGLLVVTDHASHAGLSPAQTYVLSTHGLQLGACLELLDLRGKADGATAQAFNTERLRLLESVVVNANDAVLITEAEPINLPGPRIVYCNAAFTRATGYTQAEVLGQTPRMLQSPRVDRQALDRVPSRMWWK